jgi:hypothetical protein
VSHTLNYLHRKYPNPFATHVHTVDTLSRHIDPETGIIRSERIIGVQQGAPKWITKLFSLPPMAYVREIVFINPPGTGEDKTLPTSTSMSINLSLAQYVYVPSSSCVMIKLISDHASSSSLINRIQKTRPFSNKKQPSFPDSQLHSSLEK